MRNYFSNPSFRNQVYALMHQLLMAGYGFLLLFVMIRVMNPDQVGRWVIFASALSLCDMMMHGLLQTKVVKESALARKHSLMNRSIQTNAVLISMVLLLMVFAVSVLIYFVLQRMGIKASLPADMMSWYPFSALSMLFFNLSWWVNMGKENFKFILIQRVIYVFVSFCCMLVMYCIDGAMKFNVVAGGQVVGYAVSSFVMYFMNKFQVRYRYVSRAQMGKFLGDGKFNFFTMIGSSLLRSADTFMIAFLINSSAVAMYTIAQKVIEIFEVMLRTIATTSLPVLFHIRDQRLQFSHKLIIRIFTVSAVFIPAAILVFIFSDQMIEVLAGSTHYGISSAILKVFVIYIILLPADRMLGVALEACNEARLNMFKTFTLFVVNISGNLAALHYFKSLVLVSAVSSIALSFGIVTAIFFLRRKGFLRWSDLILVPRMFSSLNQHKLCQD